MTHVAAVSRRRFCPAYRRSHSSSTASPESNAPRSWRARSSSVGRRNSVKPGELPRPAQRIGEPLVDVRRALQRLSERSGGLRCQADALTLSENLLGPERCGLQHKRRDIQMRRGGSPLQNSLFPRLNPDLQSPILRCSHVLTMAVQAEFVKHQMPDCASARALSPGARALWPAVQRPSSPKSSSTAVDSTSAGRTPPPRDVKRPAVATKLITRPA
jgi:hypothetical protein